MTATQDSPLTVEGTYAGDVGDGMIVLTLPGTEYRHHLMVDGPVGVDAGKPVAGRIYARARRVDVISAGGHFVEPIYGRPRRVQGRIIATDPADGTITVRCSCPIICELTANQSVRDFKVGQIVTFSVERGARFERKT